MCPPSIDDILEFNTPGSSVSTPAPLPSYGTGAVPLDGSITDSILTASRQDVPCELVNENPWEWVHANYLGVSPQTHLSDFVVRLSRPRKFFYLVQMAPPEQTWLHFHRLFKYLPGAAAFTSNDGTEEWIPFPRSGEFGALTTNGISNVASIEFDSPIDTFMLTQVNGAGGVPHNITILASSVRLRVDTTKQS